MIRRHRLLLIVLAVAGGLLAAFALVIVTQRSEDASAAFTCEASFARFKNLEGHWSGSWENHTFSSHGDLDVDVTIEEGCAAQGIFDGIFGQPDPQTVVANYRDENGTTLETQGDPIFGSSTIVVDPAGVITIDGDNLHMNIEHVQGTGTLALGQMHIDITLTFSGGGGAATESIDLTKDILLIQGDFDCDGDVDPADALGQFRSLQDLPIEQWAGCPVPKAQASPTALGNWGDVDCDGTRGPLDGLKTLAFVADLEVQQESGCVEIGQPILA